MSPRAFAIASGAFIGFGVIAAFNSPGYILAFTFPGLILAIVGMNKLPRR